jgi:nucleoside phosphorylase
MSDDLHSKSTHVSEPVDVAVVTALQEELDPFLSLIGQHPDGRDYYLGSLDTVVGKLRIAAATVNKAGGDAIIAALGRVLPFQPRLIAMIGICAGPRGKTLLGDLIIADFAFHEREGKDTDDGFEPEGRTYRPYDTDLLNWAVTLPAERLGQDMRVQHPDRQAALVLWSILKRGTEIWRPRLRQHFSEQGVEVDLIDAWLRQNNYVETTNKLTPEGYNWLTTCCAIDADDFVPDGSALNTPRINIAPAVQSPSVQAHNDFFHQNQKRARKLRMCDMESASFYYTLEDQRTAGLVVKSVVDYADSGKDDRFHRYGSEASTQWLITYIRVYADRIIKLPRPRPRGVSGTTMNHTVPPL